jgi:putative ABC transport system ATP-binding protein
MKTEFMVNSSDKIINSQKDKNERDFIWIKDLSKSFQEGECNRIVLDNVNVSFVKGEFVAILGKSGSGKSTLLNLISGIEPPDSGEIWLAGINLSNHDEHQRTIFRRNNIGFVFQFFNLLPTLTVAENVKLPLELSGISTQEAQERAALILQDVGLIDRMETFPDRLSGGEQQRVAIARALIHKPILVLADEPTGNLDEDTGNSVLTLLDRLTRQVGYNLILVTHSLEAASIADRILFLRDGKLVEQDL